MRFHCVVFFLSSGAVSQCDFLVLLSGVTRFFPSSARLTDDGSIPRASSAVLVVSEFVNMFALTLFAYTIMENVTAGSFRRWFVGSALAQTDDWPCRDAPSVLLWERISSVRDPYRLVCREPDPHTERA